MNNELSMEFRKTINMTERLRKQHNHPERNRMSSERGQGRVLLLLSNKNISQKELLFLLDCRPQSLAETLKKLEIQELIERFPSEEDKRRLDIRLTEKGKMVASDIAERTKSEKIPLELALDVLEENEKEQLLKYMEKINSSLETIMIDSGFGRGRDFENSFDHERGRGHRDRFNHGHGRRGR